MIRYTTDEQGRFAFEQRICSYNVDRRLRLRPSAFMEFAQQMAYDGADILGFGEKKMIPLGAAWILARMHFRYVRTPLRDEDVILKTWHKGAGPIFFRRDFEITGADGQTEMLGTSEWIIMDIKQRKMVRTSAVDASLVPATPQSEADALSEAAPKIVVPKGVEMVKIAEHKVLYTDIDINQHTNNTRYIAWAMDCLDEALTRDHDVSDVYINFNREAKPQEVVDLMYAEADGAFYVEGKVDGIQVFISKITFKQ